MPKHNEPPENLVQQASCQCAACVEERERADDACRVLDAKLSDPKVRAAANFAFYATLFDAERITYDEFFGYVRDMKWTDDAAELIRKFPGNYLMHAWERWLQADAALKALTPLSGDHERIEVEAEYEAATRTYEACWNKCEDEQEPLRKAAAERKAATAQGLHLGKRKPLHGDKLKTGRTKLIDGKRVPIIRQM